MLRKSSVREILCFIISIVITYHNHRLRSSFKGVLPFYKELLAARVDEAIVDAGVVDAGVDVGGSQVPPHVVEQFVLF